MTDSFKYFVCMHLKYCVCVVRCRFSTPSVSDTVSLDLILSVDELQYKSYSSIRSTWWIQIYMVFDICILAII